jgi:hypothetical protein
VADLVIACDRAGHPPAHTAEDVRRAALLLAPDGSEPREPRLAATDGVLAAIAGPATAGVWLEGDETPAAAAAGDASPGDGNAGAEAVPGAAATRPAGAVCIGGLFGDHGRWSEPGSEPPDGTYALARWDREVVELLTDVCASRTLWYALTDDAFFASTSQRALVALLGSFALDERAVAWTLTAGSLGPEVAWDARLRRVPPDARVVLDRAAWRVDVHQPPVIFTPLPGEPPEHVARLRAAIEATCAELDVDRDRWVLTLSGGIDTRVLLATLVANGLRPRCVTWSTRASLRNPLSDASIARLLARHYKVDHELLDLDGTECDLETAVDRFVAADLGRNDEAGGYLDGFAMWRRLTAAGVEGIIRGDEPFGDRRGPSELPHAVMRSSGSMAGDYPEGHLVRSLGLAPQSRPERLARRPDEDLRHYQVRLTQTAYVPTTLAGLNKAKSQYVEIVNPLLSRRVIAATRGLSLEMLGRERTFLSVMSEVSPPIPMARFTSTPSLGDVLASSEGLELIVRELTSPEIARVLHDDAPLRILAAMAAKSPAPGLTKRARALLRQAQLALPERVGARLRPGWKGPEPLSPAKLGFRALQASRAAALLERDAGALRQASTA